ncbi:MAG: DUF5362 family protein [Gammaproteobacteria bacterium]|nr:DUF5362 family protein [Gammaproteobacteria bacterium]
MENGNSNSIKDVALPLYNAKFWMQLVGVVLILQAAMIVLSTLGIGIIIAWLPGWLGILLFQSASHIDRAFNLDDREAAIRAMEKLKTYFVIQGVLFLLGVILSVLGFVMFGAMFAEMASNMGGMGGL